MIIITNLKAFYYIITLHSCTIGEFVILSHSLINMKKQFKHCSRFTILNNGILILLWRLLRISFAGSYENQLWDTRQVNIISTITNPYIIMILQPPPPKSQKVTIETFLNISVADNCEIGDKIHTITYKPYRINYFGLYIINIKKLLVKCTCNIHWIGVPTFREFITLSYISCCVFTDNISRLTVQNNQSRYPFYFKCLGQTILKLNYGKMYTTWQNINTSINVKHHPIFVFIIVTDKLSRKVDLDRIDYIKIIQNQPYLQ